MSDIDYVRAAIPKWCISGSVIRLRKEIYTPESFRYFLENYHEYRSKLKRNLKRKRKARARCGYKKRYY